MLGAGSNDGYTARRTARCVHSTDKVLFLILFVALLIRLYGLGEQSIWADELQRIVWSKGYEFTQIFGLPSSALGVRQAPRELMPSIQVLVGHNPPLYGTLLHGWMVLTGSASDYFLRLPSALFGVVTVWAIYLAICEIGNQTAARWGAAIIAVSPFHVFYAQEINHYTLATALTAGSFVFYFRRFHAPNVWNGIGLSLCVLGGLLTHYFTGIVFAFQALGILVQKEQSTRIGQRLRCMWPFVAALMLFLPYAIVLRRQLREMTDPAQVGHFGGLDSFLESLNGLGSVLWLGEPVPTVAPWYGLALGAVAFALAVYGVWRTRHDHGRASVLLLTALGPSIATMALFWVVHVNSLLWPRYQLLFTPGLVIAAVLALPKRPVNALIPAATVAMMSIVGIHAVYYRYVKESWKPVAAVINARASDGDTVAVYRQNLVYALAHYMQRDLLLYGLTPDDTIECTTTLATKGNAVWLVSAWQEGPESTEKILRILRRRFREEEAIPIGPDRVGTQLFRFAQPVTVLPGGDPCTKQPKPGQ